MVRVSKGTGTVIIQEQLRDKRPKNSKNGKKLLVVISDQTNT